MCKEEAPVEINKGKGKIYLSKIIAGIICLILGLALLIWRLDFFRMFFTFWNRLDVMRSVAWSLVGIGAGLINTRTDKPSSCWLLHYFGYYSFVLLVISLASFLAAQHSLTWAPTGKATDASAALVGLIGGFLGHKFHDLAFKFSPKSS